MRKSKLADCLPPTQKSSDDEVTPSRPSIELDQTHCAALAWERFTALALGRLDGVEAIIAEAHAVIDDCAWDYL